MAAASVCCRYMRRLPSGLLLTPCQAKYCRGCCWVGTTVTCCSSGIPMATCLQVMLRVGDLDRSIKFYTGVIIMSILDAV